MKRLPSKVVATPGYSTSVDNGKRRVQITQFEPVDLLEYFSGEEIQNSESLREALRQKWVVAYEGQELPKQAEPKIKIPEMIINKGSFSSAKIKITEQKKKGKKSDFDFEVKIPKETQEKINQAQTDYKRKKLEEKEELIRKQKEELEVDNVIATGKVKIPEITTIRIDGKEIMDWKAVKKGTKPVEENRIKVDLQEKTVTEKE